MNHTKKYRYIRTYQHTKAKSMLVLWHVDDKKDHFFMMDATKHDLCITDVLLVVDLSH